MALRLLRALGLLIGLIAATTDARAGDALTVQELAPGVYAHEGAFAMPGEAAKVDDIANLGFIVGDRGVAVIDTGGSVETGRRLLAAIRAVTNKPILYVVNTHEHPDHVFGNAAFDGLGAVFVGHHNLPRSLAARESFYRKAYAKFIGAELMAEVRFIAPTRLVAEEDELDLGGRKLVLRAWPVAHTDCDLTVYDSASRILFAGDLLFSGHVPVLDGSLKGWLTTLDALSRVKAERVVPGHGALGAPWPAALDAERGYLRQLAEDVRAFVKRGADISEAARSAGAEERSKWKLFDEYNPRNATAAFAEYEWE
jgi:quinoprotein relay system zinc metallohydrolase 2